VAAEEEAAEYPRLLAAARHVPTAARPWVTAEVPQPAAVREAALRPQEAVAVVVAAVAAAPQSGDPSVVAWQARRSAGPAVSGGQAAALPPAEAGARDAVGAVAALRRVAPAAAAELPLAAAWAFRRDQVLPWPGP
jgi:hypothetical protein